MNVDISVINIYRLFFLETQEKRFHTAAQGQICYNIGKMSLKSSYECKEAATAFGKTIKSKIDAQPGWCIFNNNEVYWDVPGGGLWKREAQEICSNEGIIIPPVPPGGTIKIYYYSRLKCICI